MALDRVYAQSSQVMPNLVVTPAAVKSGKPCLFGNIPGVALEDADASNATIMQKDGIFNLSVIASNGAIVAGDLLYLDTATAAVLSNTSASSIRFGYALAAIGNGLTATIQVQVGY